MPPELLTFVFNQVPLVVFLLILVWALVKPQPFLYPSGVVDDLRLQRDDWKHKAEHATDLIALSARGTISAIDLARAQRSAPPTRGAGTLDYDRPPDDR